MFDMQDFSIRTILDSVHDYKYCLNKFDILVNRESIYLFDISYKDGKSKITKYQFNNEWILGCLLGICYALVGLPSYNKNYIIK
jgi:hypothetical protein